MNWDVGELDCTREAKECFLEEAIANLRYEIIGWGQGTGKTGPGRGTGMGKA